MNTQLGAASRYRQRTLGELSYIFDVWQRSEKVVDGGELDVNHNGKSLKRQEPVSKYTGTRFTLQYLGVSESLCETPKTAQSVRSGNEI